MKKILVLTDFSDNAQHAAAYALNLAKIEQGAALILLNTFEPPVLMPPDAGGIAPDGTPSITDYSLVMEETALIEKGNQEQIVKAKEQLGAPDPSVEITTIVKEGFLGDIANEISEQESVDLVVMGIKGRSGIDKMLIGSNAIKAIEGIDKPLLIIPDKATVTGLGKIALASDLELLKEETLHQLQAFMKTTGADSLQVVTVNKEVNNPASEERVSAIKALLQPLSPTFHFIKAENVAAGLETFVAQNNISLLVFTHHERGFFSGLFHKSVGKKIAWNTTVPVLRLKN
ncbi:hypothetical protein A8C56_04650 [Niabella ginsenosidivorans]|uniref:UspA domain-containing protein n=1 Tax=Niabella ginsenosidivorans TaxID=1176587 RepID=A0A1A9HYN2_9BACT|nr:universal stress protein [Niabella ginsenosidivorans]ANH80363.1 hypothetical protein A8C56_04650 [Niabella ginsenosidivorans]